MVKLCFLVLNMNEFLVVFLFNVLGLVLYVMIVFGFKFGEGVI